MDTEQKLLMRAAVRLHAELVRRGRNSRWSLPADDWAEVAAIAGQIAVARKRGWQHAAAARTDDLAYAAESCQRRLDALASQLRNIPSGKSVANASDIYRDLLALRDEFEEVSCDLEAHVICATTSPIVLEGIDLGRFEIRLDWDRLNLSPAYRVVALDANPSSQREEVTHPHVSDECVCEGDGQLAIRSALDQGRIGDFFMIVSNLLKTYSQGNAYVELSDWDGRDCCNNCDASCSSDESYFCHGCDTSLCSECAISCNSCGDDYCSGCISGCTHCNVDYCSACLKKCRACNASACPNCLQEGDLCKACFEKQQAAEKQNETASQPANVTIPAAHGAAVQPHGVGQAAILARPRDERGRWIRRHAA